MTEFANTMAFDSPHAIWSPNSGRKRVWYGAQVNEGSHPSSSCARIRRRAGTCAGGVIRISSG